MSAPAPPAGTATGSTSSEVAGHEVRVEVGQDDVFDPNTQALGVLQVVVDVALWIHHHADAIVPEQVGEVRETGEVVLLQDHVGLLLEEDHPTFGRQQPLDLIAENRFVFGKQDAHGGR